MAQCVIMYWCDIPAQIIVRGNGRTVKRMLSDRFQQAVDFAVMRAGARDSDTYMAEWRMANPIACGDDLEVEANAAANRIEAHYDEACLKALVAAGGRGSPPTAMIIAGSRADSAT